MSEELKPGVYRHFKDGRFYLVLWEGLFEGDDASADENLVVSIDSGKIRIAKSPAGHNYDDWHSFLCIARSHGPLKFGVRVAVYVPLYADKPGRRISVRAVSEFSTRRYGDRYGVPRFTYVGDTIPEAE